MCSGIWLFGLLPFRKCIQLKVVLGTGEPFHKQKLFLLLWVHIRRKDYLRMYSVPVSLPWSTSEPCCRLQPLLLQTWAFALNIPVLCCHMGMRALQECHFVIKCHTLGSMVMEVFSSLDDAGILCAHLISSPAKDHHSCGLWGAAAGWEHKQHFGFLYNEKPELDYIKSFEVLLNVWLPAQLVKSAEKCLCCFSVNLKLIFSLPAWSATEGHLTSVIP